MAWCSYGVAGTAPSKKQVLYMLNSSDPDAAASVKEYLHSLFKGAKIEPTKPDDSLELTSKVEKKYMAAQVVEYGLQVRFAGRTRVCIDAAQPRPNGSA